MSLPGPPPPPGTSITPPPVNQPWRIGTSLPVGQIPPPPPAKYNHPTLESLADIWNNGGTNSQGQVRTADQMRWDAICLLRGFLHNQIPARLSDVGVSIGSNAVANQKSKHIDVDWYGAGSAPGNWWKGSINGADAERLSAEGLLHYLERSLGLKPSGTHPSEWSWPGDVQVENPEEAIKDETWGNQVQVKFPVEIEWWVGASPVFHTVEKNAIFVFMTPLTTRN